MSKFSIPHLALLAAICFLAISPFFWLGNPSGHDFEFHMYSWMEVLSQWKQGIVYPRWAELAHWGYGEARFLFYPPASWTLGAALGSFLPWHFVPGVYIWIALFLSGSSMFYAAKHWLSPPHALFAATLYTVNPYHLLIVYWRSAFAELLTAALLPLLLFWTIRLEDRCLRPVLWLALILSAAWLTNAPAAVMIHYSFALFAAIMAVMNRSWRILGKAGAAVLLGAGMASFFLLPAAYEEKWVNIAEVLSPGVQPQDNFLFTRINDADHNRFNLLVSVIAATEVAVVVAALWFSRAWRKQQRNLWILISAWAAVSALIMFSITNVFWEYLPKLRFVQLPWRWLLCLNTALALLLAVAVARWSFRVLAAIGLIMIVGIAGWRIQPPWWDHVADIREMATAMSDGTGNEGTDEYVPTGADPYEVNREQPRVVARGKGMPARDCACSASKIARNCNQTVAQVLSWGPSEEHFLVKLAAPENLVLRLFNYPAWTVTINGHPARTETTDVTGQMVLSVPAGKSDVLIHFERTPDRTLGDEISFVSIGGFLALWWKSRQPRAQWKR